jgi:hypothetical protein
MKVRNFRRPSADDIQRGIERDAQFWADVTQQETVAFDAGDGIVRFQRADFPHPQPLTRKAPAVRTGVAA